MNEQWYYGHEKQRFGPVSVEELRQLIDSDRLCAEDLVWQKGLGEWTPAGQVEGLFLPPPLLLRPRGDKAVVDGRSQSRDEPPALPARVAQKFAVSSNGALGPGQPQVMPDTIVSTSRHPPLGSPDDSIPEEKVGFRDVAMPVGCALAIFGVGLAFALMLSAALTSTGSGGSPRSHSTPGRQSSSLPVPADRDGLRRALEEGDRLWNNGQKSQAMSYYAAVMESPHVIEFKETIMQGMFPRMMQYFVDEKNEAGIDKMVGFTVEKGIRLRSPDPEAQAQLDNMRAEYLNNRINRQLQENGIPVPEGGVSQEFIDGVNYGLDWGRRLAKHVQQAENMPSGVLPAVREEARRQQIEFCLKTLRDQENDTAEVAKVAGVAQAVDGTAGRVAADLHRHRGICEGLRAAFRKAGIVQ